MTTLIEAAKSNDFDAIEALLAEGVDIFAVDDEGNTAIDYCDDPRIIELLTKLGAKRKSGGTKAFDLFQLVASAVQTNVAALGKPKSTGRKRSRKRGRR